jgi:hypothetical protein
MMSVDFTSRPLMLIASARRSSYELRMVSIVCLMPRLITYNRCSSG